MKAISLPSTSRSLPIAEQRRRAQYVEELRVRSRGANLAALASALDVVLRMEAWRERWCMMLGRSVRFDRFVDFVTTPQPEGLGETPQRLESLIRDQGDTLRRFRAAMKGEAGRPARDSEKSSNNVTVFPSSQRGNRRAYGLQRLEEKRPDLYAQVCAKTLTTHQAMVRAGLRRPTATIYTDRLSDAVAILLKHFSRDELLAALAPSPPEPDR